MVLVRQSHVPAECPALLEVQTDHCRVRRSADPVVAVVNLIIKAIFRAACHSLPQHFCERNAVTCTLSDMASKLLTFTFTFTFTFGCAQGTECRGAHRARLRAAVVPPDDCSTGH